MLSERRLAPAKGRVSAFLDSQRGLMSYYAAEGKADSATWPNATAGDSRPQSPMLVPRAAAAKGDGLRTKTCSATSDKSGPSLPIDIGQTSSSISKVEPKQDDLPHVARSVPAKPAAPKQNSMGQDQSLDDEAEHLQRLAQRRNRRRARRFAMRGAEDADDTEAGPSENDDHRSSKRPKTRAMESKGKKKRVAPALLLMQNFSAQNLGKSRLTIKPSATVGVFNKGKASGKVKTNNNHNKRAGKLALDIVFSESKFLNKTRSAHSDSGTLEDDSDYSDNHSDHSLVERANRRKVQKESPNKASNVEPGTDHSNASGSPAPSPKSVREDSPAWDIEQQTLLTRSPTKSIARPSNQRSPQPPPMQKDITVEVERYAWASKLRHPELHIPAPQGGTGLGSIFHERPARPPSISPYFKVADMPTESRITTTPPPDLDRLVAEPPSQDINPVVPPDHIDPPSTPECLQVEHPQLYSIGNAHCMRVPETHLSRTNSINPLSHGPPRIADLREIGTHSEHYPGEMEDTMSTWNSSAFEDDHAETLDDRAWNDVHVCDWNKTAFEYIPAQEEDIYENCPGLEYDFVEDDAGCPYSDMENPIIFYPEDEGAGCGEFDGDTRVIEESSHYPIYYSAAEEYEQPSSVLLPWAATDGNDHIPLEQPSPLPSEPEFEPIEEELLEDEGTEQEPRLVQIITDESLRSDLAKSMSNHWRLAHRLY